MPSLSFKTSVEQKLGKFPQFLIFAILEWVMITLLFIDGFLAFVSNEFAKFFDLRIPCLLCTRIDHILVHRNSNFYYNDSICEVHKRDISSLAYCHMHKQLSDIRKMCEGCLLSFATEKDTDCDRYKSLVGILNKDIDLFVYDDDQRTYLRTSNKDDATQIEKEDSPQCSCCGDLLKTRSSSKFGRSLSINASLAPTPSPRAPLQSRRNEEVRNLELPHIRYTELKFIADNVSELPEDENASTRYNQRREDVRAVTVSLLPDSEDMNDDVYKTPSFVRGNKFFGIPLSDSAQVSPKYRASKRMPLDKEEFISEPNDINALNEADGDFILHHLKRQVRLDRKSLMALYMELDEERSASAVAANNAMAMITRLQAEKAAVQMEALQYQRLMEEQAEYDQEALQVLKDLVKKRDEEIRVLESDLEVYRDRYGQIKRIGSEVCEVDADEDYQGLKSQSFSSFSEKSDSGSLSEVDQNGVNERSGEFRGENLDESSLDFESERSYLLGLLSDLERNFNVSLAQASHSSESNMVHHGEQDRGDGNKPTLAREVSLIKDRLRAVEADSGFLKHAAMTLQKGGEGTKLLTEIAQHLQKFRHSPKIL